MKFIEKAIKKSISNKVDDLITLGAIHLSEEIQAKQEQKLNTAMNYQLVIVQKKNLTGKRNFIVSDTKGTPKYTIKTDTIHFGYPCIRLYTPNQNELAYIEKERILPTKSISSKYHLYLEKSKLGSINQTPGIKLKLNLDLNGWHLEGNILQNIFDVYDKEHNLVLQIDTTKSEESKDVYVLKYTNPHNEIIGLLFVMTIELCKNANQ